MAIGRPRGSNHDFCRRGHHVADPTIGIWPAGGGQRYCRICLAIRNDAKDAARTHCANGHDLRLPGAVRMSFPGGRPRKNCVECKRGQLERRRERKDEASYTYLTCEVCAATFFGREGRKTCGTKCRDELVRKLSAERRTTPQSDQQEGLHAARMIRLYEELDRETRAWMRPEIEARIREAMQGR